jgi:hypothetical protein
MPIQYCVSAVTITVVRQQTTFDSTWRHNNRQTTLRRPPGSITTIISNTTPQHTSILHSFTNTSTIEKNTMPTATNSKTRTQTLHPNADEGSSNGVGIGKREGLRTITRKVSLPCPRLSDFSLVQLGVNKKAIGGRKSS